MKHNKEKFHSETPGTSISQKSGTKLQGLPTHDRVELLQTVSSLLKHPVVMKMSPKSMPKMPLSTVKDLWYEKDEVIMICHNCRLCEVLDGTSFQSDTESSTSDSALGGAAKLDDVSLESISSDEGDNGAVSSRVDIKPKHCKRRKNASKGKEKDKDKDKDKKGKEKDKDSPIVLELLELLARARAITAQLDNEHGKKKSATNHSAPDPIDYDDTDDDVVIKEEPREVVELSSSDEDESATNHSAPDPIDYDDSDDAVEIKEEPREVVELNSSDEDESATNHSAPDPIDYDNSDDDVVIKEEPREVVELSSSDENESATNHSAPDPIDYDDSDDDVVIKEEPREVVELSSSDEDRNADPAWLEKTVKPEPKTSKATQESSQTSAVTSGTTTETTKVTEKRTQKKTKKKGKGKKKKKAVQEESDHDDSSLQLSDTENTDLLDDILSFILYYFGPVTSSSSADLKTSSRSSDENEAVSENNNNKQVLKPGAENEENHGQCFCCIRRKIFAEIDVSESEKADKSPIAQEGEVEPQDGEKSGQGDDVTEKDGFANEANTQLHTATAKKKEKNTRRTR